MKIPVLLRVLMVTFSVTALTAQNDIDTVYRTDVVKRSTSFASMTFGAEVLSVSGAKTTIENQSFVLHSRQMPRLTLGGLHFWGHADFYVTFPLGLSLVNGKDEAKSTSMTESVETGMKIYPFAIGPNKLRPFVGISFQPFSYKFEKLGTNYAQGATSYERFITPLQLGLTYASKKYLFTVAARYNWKNKFDYYYTPTQTAATTVNPWNFSIGVLRYIDTDRSLATDRAVDQLNKRHYLLKKHHKLSAWYWAIGPSTALQMSKSPYFEKRLPFLKDNLANSFLMPEISFGRYFHPSDMNISASFRTMQWKLTGFDTKINMSRTSFALEAYKFLFDYHGFVPFFGPSVGVDYLTFKENGVKSQAVKPALGIVFGWDIRLTQTGSSLLRTNLRYMPGHHLKVNGEKVMFDHLEFNFIQYVHFIGRNKVYQQYRRK